MLCCNNNTQNKKKILIVYFLIILKYWSNWTRNDHRWFQFPINLLFHFSSGQLLRFQNQWVPTVVSRPQTNPFPAQVSPVPFSGSGARVFAEIPHPIKSLNLKVLLLIYCKLKAMPFRWSRCCCCSLWCGALGFSMFLLLSRPANRKATTQRL